VKYFSCMDHATTLSGLLDKHVSWLVVVALLRHIQTLALFLPERKLFLKHCVNI
jgi:hypothetical protein